MLRLSDLELVECKEALKDIPEGKVFITTIYAAISRRHWVMTTAFAVITIGIWWTAVYSGHHYVIDVLLGILTAVVGILLFEAVLMRLPAFKRFIGKFADSI